MEGEKKEICWIKKEEEQMKEEKKEICWLK
jgi:hypothetical protein